MNIEKIKRLWDKAQEYSNSLPPEEISVQRTVGFYDCLCRLDSSHPEQGEQGEVYKWVKASEDWERNLSGEMVRDKFNKWPIPYRSVTKSESFGNKFLRFWLSEFDIHTYQAENVEWLCKLSSPPPEGQDELFKDIFNTLISSGDYLSYDIRSSIESLKSKYIVIKK